MSYLTNYVKRAKGFTLIELIVVIGIIGVLATLGIGSYSNIQKSSRNAKRKADLKAMKTAIEEYNVKNGSYPNPGWGWGGTCANYGSYSDTGAGGYIPGLAPDFIDVLPRDPRENKDNGDIIPFVPGCVAASACYLYLSNGTDYKLLAHCTPEGNPFNSKDPFYDPVRTGHAWQVHSSSASVNW